MMLYGASRSADDRAALRRTRYRDVCELIGMEYTRAIMSAPVSSVARVDGNLDHMILGGGGNV